MEICNGLKLMDATVMILRPPSLFQEGVTVQQILTSVVWADNLIIWCKYIYINGFFVQFTWQPSSSSFSSSCHHPLPLRVGPQQRVQVQVLSSLPPSGQQRGRALP